MRPIDIKLKVTNKLRNVVVKLPLNPNHVTSIGWVACLLGIYMLYTHKYMYASILFFITFSCDIFDGIVARVKQKATLIGSFYDWFTDKCVEALMLLSFIFMTKSLLPELNSISSLILGCIGAKADKLNVNHDIGAWAKISRAPLIIIMPLIGHIDFMLSIYLGMTLGFITIRLIDVYVELVYGKNTNVYICPFCGEVNKRPYKAKQIICNKCYKIFKTNDKT